jgi:hypothetical protein
MAEAMRLVKNKVQQVCKKLQLTLVDKNAKTDAPLLPATCGQLENLRLSDLGGSARALVTALREDMAGTVVPALFKRLQAELLNRSDLALVALVTRLAMRAASGGLPFIEDKTAAGSVQPEVLRAVVEVGICACQSG